MAKKTRKNLSRQRLRQIQNRDKGICESCSSPAVHPYVHCQSCLDKRRKLQGNAAWKPGSRGRPPHGMKSKMDAAYAAAQAAFESVLQSK